MARTKGTTLVSLVRFLRRQRDVAEKRLPAHLAHYLDERIHVSSWYPEEDLVELMRVVAPMLGEGIADPYELMGRVTVREHFEGSYSHLFSGAEDPLQLPARAFALWATQHDTGRMRTVVEPPDAVRVELVEFGMPSREMCAVVRGYLSETLRVIGFVAESAQELECRLDGAPQCSWRCRFELGEKLAALRT